jgi:GrpB-like predicted nucleotidyltransferase (UPF0157 family)
MLLREYTTIWVHDFQTIKIILHEALQHIPVTIEHIGSTAVPGLAAKPIIDIDIIFENNVSFHEIKNSLEALGYYHNGNQGIVHRDVFKRAATFVAHELLDTITHHLYVCPANSEELRRHLLFRNYLRTHKKARNEYQQLKHLLAVEANQDKQKYAVLKEEKAKSFIETILIQAEFFG